MMMFYKTKKYLNYLFFKDSTNKMYVQHYRFALLSNPLNATSFYAITLTNRLFLKFPLFELQQYQPVRVSIRPPQQSTFPSSLPF